VRVKISFVIPSYNSVTWLPHAVASCLEQTYPNIEVVVVNDGSTDRTAEYLEWLKHNSKVKIITNTKNLGRSLSRNLGNMEASGDVICVLDADDIATPNRAELAAKKMRDGRFDYVYGGATIIDSIGRPLYEIGADVFDKDLSLKRLQNRIVHSAAAYTKEFADKFPYRDGEIAKLGIDDWAQQIEARLAGARFDFISQRLCCYRELTSQITKTRDEAAVKSCKEKFLASLLAVSA
jgi:glycosyltransferase involved in cell wall biosynthesis